MPTLLQAAALALLLLASALWVAPRRRVAPLRSWHPNRVRSWLWHGVLGFPPRSVREHRRRERERAAREVQLRAALLQQPLTHDPAACAPLERFRGIAERSECSFAKAAVVWAGPEWRPGESAASGAARALPALARFCAEGEAAELDGFLIEVRLREPPTVEQWGQAVRETLTAVVAGDPAQEGARTMDPERVGRRGWIFRWMAEDFFVTTFATCYGESHARWMFGQGALPAEAGGGTVGYVLLQPEWSFGQKRIGADHPWDASKRTQRQLIREKFVAAGRGYKVPEGVFYARGHFVVPPLEAEGEDVLWWVAPAGTGGGIDGRGA